MSTNIRSNGTSASFIRLLLGRHNRNRIYLIAWLLAATFSSVAAVGLITTIVGSPPDKQVDFQGLGLFLIIAALVIYSQHHVINMTVDTCETAVERQRREFAQAIRYADLETVEALSTARLYGLLNRTTAVLTEAGPPVISALITTGIMISIGLYALYLSIMTFVVMVVTATATIYVARHYNQRAEPDIHRSQVAERAYMDLFIQLLDGIKEVKLNAKTGDELQDGYIAIAASRTHAEKQIAARATSKAYTSIYLGFYLLISAVVFAVPQYIDNASSVTKITYIAIFLIATLNIVLRAMPMLGRANQALMELEDIKDRLHHAREGNGNDGEHGGPGFHGIGLKDCSITFAPGGDNAPPPLGPFSLEIEPGEIVAVTGPTGSGKTTLLRILAGLAHPSEGRILWDGKEVSIPALGSYRSLFAAVFLDSHLFDRLYGVSDDERDVIVSYATELGIDPARLGGQDMLKGHFSMAQKQRLLTAFALTQDRPVLILDDIEAGQDEWFINKLIQDILPRLKTKGTTVVLATSRKSDMLEAADRIISLGSATAITDNEPNPEPKTEND